MHVLVVEDEARIRSFLAAACEVEGFRVDVAEDGEQGLQAALAGDYEFVILDLTLPGRDGLGVLQELHLRRPRLPVLILSARHDLATKLRGFELGAVDYLAKPFSLDELFARIRVHTRVGGTGGGGGSEKILQVGRLVLDLSRRQAKMGTSIANLPDREFRLLLVLMLHPGEVVSRQRLLSEVWGFNFDPGSNVVDVCVRRLRRHLGADAVQTVRNAGYRAAA